MNNVKMGCLKSHDLIFVERFLLSFKVLSGDVNGLIDFQLFKNYLDKNGSNTKEVMKLIRQEQCVKNDQLNYLKLCAAILETKTAFNSLFLENGSNLNPGNSINSQTFTRKRNSNPLSEEYAANSCEIEAKEGFSQQIGGCAFSVNKDLLGHRYLLEIFEDSQIELSAKPTKNHGEINVPFEALVFEDVNKPALPMTSYMNSEGCNISNYHLPKGKYVVVPALLNWPDVDEEDGNEKVSVSRLGIRNKNVLKPECEQALRTVFDSIDLDRNGLLNQQEFDIFIQHTSGETTAEEWTTIEDNLTMENDQLTFEGFLELYRMVIASDPDDMINMFHLMGFNHLLEQKHAEPFTLCIKSSSSKFLLRPMPVESYRVVVERSVCQMAVENGVSRTVKGTKDIVLYSHELPHRASVIVQNQSQNKVNVKLDCSKSTNYRTHRGYKNAKFTACIPPKSTIVGHHLVPNQRDHFWNVKCVEELL